MNTIVIKYAGSDLETFGVIKDYYDILSTPETQYEVLCLDEENLNIDVFLTKPTPHLIFIDLTETHDNFSKLWMQLSLCKNYDLFKKIPVIGFYKDKEHLENFRMTLHYGVNYAFIKGNELKVMLKDSELIAFNKFNLSQFAKASLNYLPYTAKSPILLSQFKENGICFDSDLELDNEILIEKLAPAESPQKLIIEEKFESSFSSDAIFHYKCKFNLPNAWDDIDPNLLQSDTINTYLENHVDEFAKEKISIYLCDSSPQLMFDLVKNKKKILFNIMYQNCINTDQILLVKPSLIFINNDEEENQIEHLIAKLQEVTDYLPIIILFNIEDSTDNLRLVYKYQNLLSYQDPMDFDTVYKLLNVFSINSNKLASNQDFNNIYRLFDADRCAKILTDIKIVSITEHELCFYSQQPLIMFTNLIINVPVKAHVLIIPPEHPHTKSELHGYFYQGIIHGVESSDTNTLRQFVNHAIATELKEFKLNVINVKKTIVPIEEVQKEEVIEENDNVVPMNKFVVKRASFLKTKL